MIYYFLFLLLTILNTLLITTIVDIILMGAFKIRFNIKEKKADYLIETDNHIDFQSGNQCAGYSTAYLLRHLGISANGVDVYSEIPSKKTDGTIYPKQICKFLKTKNIKSYLCCGNIKALKNEVLKGSPVIVFIRSEIGKNYLHYTCVVGYDKEFIYVADSLEALSNCREKQYNRKISIKDFKRFWNTSLLKMPLYRNIFISSKSI